MAVLPSFYKLTLTAGSHAGNVHAPDGSVVMGQILLIPRSMLAKLPPDRLIIINR
jgi:hypothetical protein